MSIKSIKSIIDWYKDRYMLSSDLRDQIATKNLTNLFVVLHFIFAFGVVYFGIELIIHKGDIFADFFKFIYLSIFIIISLVGILLSALLRKLPNVHFVIKSIPYIQVFIAGYALSIYLFVVMHNSFSGLICFASIGIISILTLQIEPIIFVSALIVFNVLVYNEIFTRYSWVGVMDTILLSLLLYGLSLSKRKALKRDLLRTQNLEENREVLQGAIADQIEEIHSQRELLDLQHRKIIEMQNNTIISLSNLVENRDSDTGEHVRRTSAYVNLIALKARVNNIYTDILTDDYISLITKAAPMHDIGKIVVPDNILKKPGKLTPEEFEQIKRHTVEGGRIVEEVIGDHDDKEYLQIAKEIATCHHERWDGKGYPEGLKEDEIPLSARIMAIADVFDALVSPRCYKEPFPIETAMDIIKKEAGSHFDPLLAELFLSMQDDAMAIMEKYKD